jgi:hypothetical protein
MASLMSHINESRMDEINFKSLSSTQWETVKQRLIKQARVARSQAIWEMVQGFFLFLEHTVWRATHNHQQNPSQDFSSRYLK